MQMTYHLSDEARKRLFVETGRDPGQTQRLQFDPADLTAEERRFILEVNPRMNESIILEVPRWDKIMRDPRTHTLELNDLVTDASAVLAVYRDAWASGQATVLAALNEQLDAKIAELTTWSSDRDPGFASQLYGRTGRMAELEAAYAVAKQRATEAAERHRAANERMKAYEAAQREAREAEKRAWIEAHGSAFLKRACGAGYDCQYKYALERASVEFPGYTLDWRDKAAWKDRSCPGEAALDEALARGGTVVWLTDPADTGADDDRYDFEPCEAVVVRQFLSKYDLIKEF